MKLNHSIISFILVIIINSCIIPDNQDVEMFENNKYPEILEKLANPKPNLAEINTNKEQEIKVAVIDSGVDYLHKDLKNHMWYDNENNETYVGIDYVANDRYAFPRYVKTSFFGLGSEINEDGKLIIKYEDPIKEFQNKNLEFRDYVMEEIKKEKDYSILNYYERNFKEKKIRLLTEFIINESIKSPNNSYLQIFNSFFEKKESKIRIINFENILNNQNWLQDFDKNQFNINLSQLLINNSIDKILENIFKSNLFIMNYVNINTFFKSSHLSEIFQFQLNLPGQN